MKYFTLLKLIDKICLIPRTIQVMIVVARQYLNVHAEAIRDLQMTLHFLLCHSLRRNCNYVDVACRFGIKVNTKPFNCVM